MKRVWPALGRPHPFLSSVFRFTTCHSIRASGTTVSELDDDSEVVPSRRPRLYTV